MMLLRKKAVASAWNIALQRESATQQARRAALHQQYFTRLSEMAEDPVKAPPGQAIKLRAEEAAFLTEITEGVAVCLACRRTECRFFGRTDQWIMMDENHFRCPNCGEVSKLWSESKRSRTGNVIPLLPYQKVISIVDIVSGQHYAVPCKWPFEYEDTWLLDQAQMYAATLRSIADVEEYLSQTQADLHKVLEKIAVPLGMPKFH